MSQQLCSQPLPQPSKELHGVISALGNAQGLCPEWETPCSHLQQHNTQGNPGESSPVPGRSPAHPGTSPSSSPKPVTAVGQLTQGCLTPCQATAEAALTHSQDQSSSCCNHLPAHSPARWKHRQEQSHLLSREGWGV